jgi:hypothetical protein
MDLVVRLDGGEMAAENELLPALLAGWYGEFSGDASQGLFEMTLSTMTPSVSK